MALIDDIIGAWKCDDDAANTNVLDATTTNDATLIGGDNTANISVAGHLGKALNLDGDADYIRTDGSIPALNDMSIAIWINSDSWHSSTGSYMFSIGYNNTNSFLLAAGGGGNGVYYKFGETFYNFIDPLPSTGNNYLIIVTRNGTTAKTYVNGSEIDSRTVVNTQIPSSRAEIGWAFVRNNPNALFDGKLQHAYLFDADIGSAGAAELWNGGAGLAYPFTAATNIQINIADAWKDVDSMQINIGDVWKDVVEVQQNIGDVWKTVF